MAHQGLATRPIQEAAPAIRVGPLRDEIKQLSDAIARRAFEIYETHGRLLGRDLADWFQAEREMFHPSHLDVSESDGEFRVRAEVPGFAPKQLEINLEGRRLTITGKREKHEERKDRKTVYSETCSDQVLRVVNLAADVNAEAAKANLKDGILELEIPKAAPARKVPVAPKAA